MKGIIFVVFNLMVEERFGLSAWQGLLDRIRPPSGGVYTAAANYPDDEFFALVEGCAATFGKPAAQFMSDFGVFTLAALANRYPDFFKGVTAKQFLRSIDGVIHTEVKKLYPDATPPRFTYADPEPDRLVIYYSSQRRLCHFAEGLIDGTAKHFGVAIAHQQSRCQLRGDDHCRFELKFG